jgi:glucose-6-phosphate isomerase
MNLGDLHQMPKTRITKTKSWKALQAHFTVVADLHMRDLFVADEKRFQHYSLSSGQILLDYSKNRITQETMELLIALAREAGVNQAIKDMFSGEKINRTENRAVLHTALRNTADRPVMLGGTDVMQDVTRVLNQMEAFCESVVSGKWRGYSGKRIKHIINIGIGGSDLGPQMVTQALKPYWNKTLRPHFVANIDASDLNDTLADIDPETSLFIVASKTFTSIETMANARAARRWFLNQRDAAEEDIQKHFVAVSSAKEKVAAFGIAPDNMFEFWDWVGGRYSLWSAIGLPIALMIGMSNFRSLLAGAHEMDQHFHDAPFELNMPVIMAVIGVWYRDFFDASSYAILPYDHYLRKLPAYLQQGDMESNGKSITQDGDAVDCQTGPVVWGAAGANGQHAFYQLIHQGTQLIPADFIAPIQSHHHVNTRYGEHHKLLLSNCLAQTEALMWGREAQKVARDHADQPELVPHCTFAGNRPSNTLLIDKITPHNLGALIALYEHKIFVQGVIWNVNSFDQWGVELGKKLSADIEPELAGKPALRKHDSSTAALIKRVLEKQAN